MVIVDYYEIVEYDKNIGHLQETQVDFWQMPGYAADL